MSDPQYSPRYEPQPQASRPKVVTAVDRSAERVLSALAHGAIAFGLFGITFVISLAISGIIWLYARRSPQVRFHSEQAGCYQCSVLLINILLFFIILFGGGFSAFQGLQGRQDWGTGWVAYLSLIFGLIWFVGTILYGIMAAVMVLMGRPFKYIVIGDRFERRTR
ncbi:MAG TPA: DUF4870 domain-containing protein [Chloroflexia bacterium]|nr:DUF4870 domain-containing protein [Chloroflexia bacterium]